MSEMQGFSGANLNCADIVENVLMSLKSCISTCAVLGMNTNCDAILNVRLERVCVKAVLLRFSGVNSERVNVLCD